MAQRRARYNNWCFTINATPEEAVQWDTATADAPAPLQIDADAGIRYLLYQLERAPTTGQLHLQGFVTYSQVHSLAQVKVTLHHDTAHVEKMQGTVQQSIDYCTKSTTKVAGPWSVGTPPTGQGHRTDLDEVTAAIKSGASKRKICEDFPVAAVKYSKGLDYLRHTLDSCPKWRNLTVWWVWGKTGTGKTRMAMDSVDDPTKIHIVHSDGQWWDGYDGQDSILFDDFYGQIKLCTMLRYLDGHPLQLPIKGGFVYAKYTKVWITSNVHYQDIYKNEKIPDEARLAFERRITESIAKN